MKKPDINAVLAVSVRRQLDEANNLIASLMQERHELQGELTNLTNAVIRAGVASQVIQATQVSEVPAEATTK